MDRRELILDRLETIFRAIPGIVKVARNREDVSGRSRPAIILHDGGEDSADYSQRPIGTPKDFITMSPQVIVLIGSPSDEVGTDINGWRAKVLPLIMQDVTIRQLCGVVYGARAGGDLRYMGCGLDTVYGETREARLDLRFEFIYPLDPAELGS